MTLYDTYHVHILKPVALEWTEKQEVESSRGLVDDPELCGLLELVTTLYLRQRAKGNPLAADLVVGARNHYDTEQAGYNRPFQTQTLYELRPLLRRMLADLERRDATREIDADYARQARRERGELAPVEDGDGSA